VKVRWGILGCGWVARDGIAPAIHWSHNGELAAVASRDPATARAHAAAIGARRAHGSYEALLADDEIDAVYIGLPNGLHEPWALRAAEAGKDVLCEKSLTLSSASAHRLRAAFRARGLRLVEAFMYRHHPQWEIVRRLLREGAIGEVRSLRAGFTGSGLPDDNHRFSISLGGGALFDLTCYAVDATRYLLGTEPIRASAHAVPFVPGGVDVTSTAVLSFPGDVLATVHGSLRSGEDQFAVVVGTRGRIEVARPFVPEWLPAEVRIAPDGEAPQTFSTAGANQYLHQIEHFASLVLDRERPAYPAEDGVANVTVCEAIGVSIARGGDAVSIAD
jgi:D-xylose 1-dehydrogenase (NADP+, D-xylono-1,5-lactone-forming)